MINALSPHVLLIIVVLIPLGPFAAFVLTAMGGRLVSASRALWLASIGCGISLASSLIGMAILSRTALSDGNPARAIEIRVFRWLSLADPTSGDVIFTLRFDVLSGGALVVATLVAAAITAHMAASPGNRELQRWQILGASAIPACTFMALLSANFLQFFAFWQLSAAGAWLLRGTNSSNSQETTAASKTFLISRAADCFVLCGLLLLWTTLATSTFSAIGEPGTLSPLLASYLEAGGNPQLQSHRIAVVSVIALCILIGVIGRCSQFPFFGPLSDLPRGSPSIEALIQVGCLVPVGVFLLFRCQPLFVIAGEASRLTAMLGGLTAFLTAACAVTQRDLHRVLNFAAAGFCGWTLMGFGSGTTAGMLAAGLLLAAVVLAMSTMFLVAEQVLKYCGGTWDLSATGNLRQSMPAAYWAFLLATLVLATGLSGQNTILGAIGRPSAEAAVQLQPRITDGLLPALGAASMLLMGFALFRAFFLTFHHQPLSRPVQMVAKNPAGRGSSFLQSSIVVTLAMIAAVTGPAVAALARYQPFVHNVIDSRAQLRTELFSLEYGSLLALIGIVAAWMMYARPTPWPALIAARLAPLTRLSQNRFYLDDAWTWFVVIPTRGLAQLCRFVDWLIVEGMWDAVPTRIPAALTRAVRPLQTGVIQFYALSTFFATAILLAVVLWLKR